MAHIINSIDNIFELNKDYNIPKDTRIVITGIVRMIVLDNNKLEIFPEDLKYIRIIKPDEETNNS